MYKYEGIMERIIKTIEEYLEEIFNIQRKNDNCIEESHLHKGLAFRGQNNKNYELLPSIGRNRKFSTDVSILDQERNLIEMAKYKLPNIFKPSLSPVDLLALLQHFGVPTRLMDVTSNPLIALYFASLDEGNDGEVIVFDYNDMDATNYPIVNAIADSYKFLNVTTESLILFLENACLQPYFEEQRNQINNWGENKKVHWIEDCCKDLLFVNATEQVERQRIQQGFYILFTNEIIKNENKVLFNKKILPIEKTHKQIKERIIVDKDCKTDILEKLSFLGISEATLFVDNIDIVCKNIVKQCNMFLKRC